MAEVDPVILQLRAEVEDYQRKVRAATKTVDEQLGLQARRAKKLEAEMRQSTGQMAATFKNLAATLAAAFTGRELIALSDSFTRFQNQLKVAGLEGENLASVQQRLYDLGGKYGVSVNALGELYGKASQASKELGASQEQLLALTQATSQSLLITGTSTEQASGAILGLSQALASGTVRAEEFNQINEGGLRPLLEAAAATERFGGSVAKLRTAVNDGKVSSQELYQAILANADIIEGKASKATLTLSGAFQSLQDQLAKYVGESGQASGATETIANAIKLLADNLDTIIPALATIAAVIGANMVVNMGRAAIATAALAAATTGAAAEMGLMGAASFALQARLAGAATTTEALTFAMRGLAGAIAATGIGALIVALGYLATQAESSSAFVDRLTASTENLRTENQRMAGVLQAAGVALGALGSYASNAAAKIDGMNDSMGRAIGTAINLINTLNQLGISETLLKISANERQRQALINPDVSQGPAQLGQLIGTKLGLNDDRIAALDADKQQLLARLELQTLGLQNGVNLNPENAAGSTASGKSKKVKTPKGASGPSAADIEQRFNAELASYAQQALSAMQSLATNADDRAELELRSVELARVRTNAEIDADKNYSAAQKTRLKQQVEALAELERQNVERKRTEDNERAAADLADERGRAETDALRIQYDLADTQKDRRAIALQILEAEDRLLRQKLQEIIDSKVAGDAEKARAKIALDGLNSTASARRAGVERDFEGPLARYARDTRDTDTRVEEAAAQRIRDLNATIADTMAHELGIKDPFLKQLLEIFLDANIFGPLSEALSRRSAGGGLFGSILSGIGSLFGAKSGGGLAPGLNKRASGGRVSAGTMYRVNEGATPGRVEAFVPQGSGDIIPLGRMDAMRGGQAGSGQVTVRLMLSDDIDARIEQVSGPVAVQVVAASADALTKRAVGETMRQAGRPRL